MKHLILTNGNHAIIDDEDYDRLVGFTWTQHPNGTIDTSILKPNRLSYQSNRHTYPSLASMVMQRPGVKFDHKDRNKLNNQKSNLREATVSQNNMNRPGWSSCSKFKGVDFMKRKHKWRARIQVDGKLEYIGLFELELDAAKAYDDKAKELHGEFAYLNFKD